MLGHVCLLPAVKKVAQIWKQINLRKCCTAVHGNYNLKQQLAKESF